MRPRDESEDPVEGEELLAQIAWSDTMLSCDECEHLFALPPEPDEAIMLGWAAKVAREATKQGWIAKSDGRYAHALCPTCAKTHRVVDPNI